MGTSVCFARCQSRRDIRLAFLLAHTSSEISGKTRSNSGLPHGREYLALKRASYSRPPDYPEFIQSSRSGGGGRGMHYRCYQRGTLTCFRVPSYALTRISPAESTIGKVTVLVPRPGAFCFGKALSARARGPKSRLETFPLGFTTTAGVSRPTKNCSAPCRRINIHQRRFEGRVFLSLHVAGGRSRAKV